MNKKIFKNPNEVFEDQLNDIFIRSSDKTSNVVLRAVNLLLYQNEHNRDLLDLYDLVGIEKFMSILSIFENKTVVFPAKEEIKELILTALLYYYREIENLSWEEIKAKVPFDFSSISYSIKIKKFNNYIIEKLYDILKGEEDGQN